MKKKVISLLLVMLLVFSLLPMAALAEDGQADEDDGNEFGVYDNGGNLVDEGEQEEPLDDPGEVEEPQQQSAAPAAPEKLGEGEQKTGDQEESPALVDSCTVNGVRVSIMAEAGAFPKGAVFSVTAVPASEQTRADEAVESKRAENVNVAISYSFDIKVLDPVTQTELEPAEGKKVQISFALAAAADKNLDAQVYHITEDEKGELSAEVLTPVQQAQASESITVETDSFSLFTVEFTYESLKYELPGGSTVELSEILAALGLSGTVSSVQVSDPSLFSVSHAEDGRWRVTSHAHFEGEKKMLVTIGGVPYEIIVTSIETVDISVSKIWNDNDNAEQQRPATITVQLLADGEAVSGETVTLTAASRWEDAEFTGLPKYKSVQNADGSVTKTEIRYSVEEAAVEHYIDVVTGTAAEGFIITNYQTISVSVQKVWSDASDLSGFRPSSVTVHLLANDVDTGLSAKVTKTDSWKHNFEDLPKYDDAGREIIYTVREDAVAHYTTSISGNVTSGFVITNRHVPEYVTVNVRKVWSDKNNANRTRPSSVTVTLYATYSSPADTVEFDSATLSSANSWRASFTNLPKYLKGTAVTYTVEENRLSNYIPTITSTSTSTSTTYVITNTLRTSPGTGDNSHLGVWGSLLGISLLGMAALAPRVRNRAGRRKNRG